ncbi:MAG: acyltransferase domain-containing protein [Caldilineaceae bacterium]
MGDGRADLQTHLRAYLRGNVDTPALVTGNTEAEGTPVVFVFTGQGAQWWGMGRQLLDREPVFRDMVTRIDALLRPLSGWSLLTEMTRPQATSRIDRTDVAQPAIFALQVGLAELWRAWGVHPAAVVGHSVGEVAAAYVAGIYTLEGAVKIICHRSRLQNTTGGHGGMAAVGLPPADAAAAIGEAQDRVQISAINSPGLVTLAGDTEPLAAILAELEAADVFVRRLPIDYAFHTHQMEPISGAVVGGVWLTYSRTPRRRSLFLHRLRRATDRLGDDGRVLVAQRAPARPLSPPRWRRSSETGMYAFLELGPHPALRSALLACLAEAGRAAMSSIRSAGPRPGRRRR